MKLHTVCSYLMALATYQSEGFTFQSTQTRASTFIGTNVRTQYRSNQTANTNRNRRSITMYEPSFDPPRKSSVQKNLNSVQHNSNSGFWIALDDTKKWISGLLSASGQDNPHSRKEVAYQCELNQYPLGAIAGIFR